MGEGATVHTLPRLRAASAAEVVVVAVGIMPVHAGIIAEDIDVTAEVRSKIRSAEWSWPSAP